MRWAGTANNISIRSKEANPHSFPDFDRENTYSPGRRMAVLSWSKISQDYPGSSREWTSRAEQGQLGNRLFLPMQQFWLDLTKANP